MKPGTRDPKPRAKNPKHETQNPEPEIRTPEPQKLESKCGGTRVTWYWAGVILYLQFKNFLAMKFTAQYDLY